MTFESVRAQNFENLEYIVVDGSSTDSTVSLIRESLDIVTTWVSELDNGIYDALNKGINLASGDVVGFVHADDLLASPDVISKVAESFELHGADAIYGDLLYVSKENIDNVIRYWRSCPFDMAKLRRGWMPPHPSLYLRREVYEKYGLFDTKYRIAADYDFILRIFKDGSLRMAYIPEVIVKMRIGGTSNRSLKNIILKLTEDYRALRSNHVGGIGALAMKNLSKVRQFFPKI